MHHKYITYFLFVQHCVQKKNNFNFKFNHLTKKRPPESFREVASFYVNMSLFTLYHPIRLMIDVGMICNAIEHFPVWHGIGLRLRQGMPF